MVDGMAIDLISAKELDVIEGDNLHERIYVQLRRAIMAGHYLPGQVLTLRTLASRFGTSIIPVRDAVLRLVAEQALHRERRSIHVPMMTLQHFRDVLLFREALEGQAVMLAAERATESDIQDMRAANEALLDVQRNDTLEAFSEANQRFHFSVYAGAHNLFLQSLIETLWLQIGPHLGLLIRQSEKYEVRSVDLRAHEALLVAIEAHDPSAARDALISDLEDSIDIFRPWSEDDKVREQA